MYRVTVSAPSSLDNPRKVESASTASKLILTPSSTIHRLSGLMPWL